MLTDKLLPYTMCCAALRAVQAFFVESSAPFQAKKRDFLAVLGPFARPLCVLCVEPMHCCEAFCSV